MTAIDERVDIDAFTEIVENFDEDIPCAYKPLDGCENPVAWKVIFSCGHEHKVCHKHRGLILIALSKRDGWICQASGKPVDGAEWERL